MTSVPRPDAPDAAWQAAWETEDNYWFENFSSRPYSLGPDYYDRFRPAYRYGFDSAHHGLGRRVVGRSTGESEARHPEPRE